MSRLAQKQQRPLPRLFRRHAVLHHHQQQQELNENCAVAATRNVLSATCEAEDEGDHEAALDEVLIALQNATASHSDKHQLQRNKTKTIEDIKRWLQNTSESASYIGIHRRDNSQSSFERYLNKQLSEVLFDKDYATAGVKTAKANIYYDFLNEFHNEKFSISQKEEEILLSDLQLDSLVELPCVEDDIILNNEILKPPNATSYNTVNVNTKDLIIRLQETIDRFSNNNDKIVKDLQVQNGIQKEKHRNGLKNSTSNIKDPIQENFYNTSCLLRSIEDVTIHNLSLDKSDADLASYGTNVDNQNTIIKRAPKKSNFQPTQMVTRSSLRKNQNINTSPKLATSKSKFQPSIIKQNRKFSGTEHSYCREQNSESFSNYELRKFRSRNNSIISDSYDDHIDDDEEDDDKEEKQSDFYTRNPLYYTHQEKEISNALEEVGITDRMLKHIRLADDTKVWQCHQDDCNCEFVKPCSLKSHLLTHFGIKPFKCDHDGCSWAFYTEFRLKRHKETHLKKKDYVCPVPGCKRRFTTIYNLASHEKLHTRPNRVICQVSDCTARFQTKRALEAHMKTHDESLAPYVCNFEGCGKRYYSSNAFMSHQRRHSYSHFDITCSWPGCGKTFDQPCRLKAHMRSHTGLKPYACTFKGCKWAFSTSSKLKRHQKKHTNDRKFVCDVEDCKKAFMRSEHLKEHKLIHAGERFFQCHICSSAFSAKSSLYVHVKKHSNKNFVSRPHHQQKKKKTVEKKTVGQKKDIHCPRVQPIRISLNNTKKWSLESENQIVKDNIATKENENVDAAKFILPTTSFEHKTARDVHICPIDSCRKSYSTKSGLKMHLKKHVPLSEVQNGNFTRMISSSLSSQEGKIVSNELQCFTDKLCDQEIAVPFESIFFDYQTLESPIEKNLLQTEPQNQFELEPLNIKAANSTGVQVTKTSTKSNKGSARTSFTREYVLSLKPYRKIADVSVEANDVVSDTMTLDNGLLLSDNLPCMNSEEHIGLPEYQIFLLDIDPT